MSRLRLSAKASVQGWSRNLHEIQKSRFCSSSRSTFSHDDTESSGPGRGSQSTSSSLDRTVFVRPSKGLVSPVQTLTLLSELSKRFGKIHSFHFPREPHQQRLLGYGSVTFADSTSFEKAIKQSGSCTLRLPSFLPSRAPRTYLNNTQHSCLTGLEPLVSCDKPPEGTPAKQIYYSSRNLQNPSSMRPGWDDLGHLISMKTSPSAHYVDEGEANDKTPADAIVAHDSNFYLSSAPIEVTLKMERRQSRIIPRMKQHQQSWAPTDRNANASVPTQLRQFGGFSGVIAQILDKETTKERELRTHETTEFDPSRADRYSAADITDESSSRDARSPRRFDRHSVSNEFRHRNEFTDDYGKQLRRSNSDSGFRQRDRRTFDRRERNWSPRRVDKKSFDREDERWSHRQVDDKLFDQPDDQPFGKANNLASGSSESTAETYSRQDPARSGRPYSELLRPRERQRPFSRTTHESYGGSKFRSYTSSTSAPDKALRKAEWMRTRHSNFIDQITVRLNGGKGGDGCVSFHREKFVEYGPPSGGNGGTGGSVYIRAVDGPTSLARIARRSRAPDAYHGQGSFIHGRKAVDKVIEVPVGTVVTAVKRLRVKEDEEARVYRDDLLRRAAKAGWDPARSVGKEDIVLAVEHTEHERIRASLGLSRDEDADQDQEAVEKYKQLVAKIDGEALLDPETAQELQVQRDRVWRHYPRAAETNYKRNEFRAAEMRLALDYRRQLSSMRSPEGADGQSVASLTPFEGEEDSAESRWEFDFNEPTPEDSLGVLVASGGKGGYGNGTFLSSQNRSPKFATKGEWGEVVEILLELKKPSDIGLVGLPNAGKSTILRSLSASRAEVGHWQFTTLSPNLGVVRLDEEGKVLGVDNSEVVEGHGSDRQGGKDMGEEGYRLILADIPGLIDGASDNRGLGHTFLRHIERCSVLAYVLDLNQPDPAKDLRVLHNELATYRADLIRKAQLIVANKADLFGTETEVNWAKKKLEQIRLEATKIWEDICATAMGFEAQQLREAGPMKLIAVSAKKKQGTDLLAKSLVDLLKAKRAEEEALAEDANYDSSW